MQAGHINDQLLDAIKKIAFNTVNCQGVKEIPTKHRGEIIIKITIGNGNRDDMIDISSTIKTRIPSIKGNGHAIFVEDASDDAFFVCPKTGFVSALPIAQDDWTYKETKTNITTINKKG